MFVMLGRYMYIMNHYLHKYTYMCVYFAFCVNSIHIFSYMYLLQTKFSKLTGSRREKMLKEKT